ncbi:uncharacterized protein [Battus philenor]|uniref:uncharacterized protein n=1 Tax=Battus philenor TaxID=42288 RepID=UPI0035CFDCCC
MIDHGLNFKDQTERAATKASLVTAKLCRLMPNVGGPKQNRRKLLASVTTSVLMYGVPMWSEALNKQESRRKIASVYRVSTLRVASAFRTVSEDAACVIAGMVPVALHADEKTNLYNAILTFGLGTYAYCTTVLNDLRKIEQERRKLA